MTVRHIPADSADANVGTVVPLPVAAPGGGPGGPHAVTHMPFSGTDAWRQARVVTADQQIQNSIALVNITDLSNFIVVAAAQYMFDFTLLYSGPAAGDIKFGVKCPAGSAGRWGVQGAPDASLSSNNGVNYLTKNAIITDLTTPGTMNIGTFDEPTAMVVKIWGYVVIGGTGGTLQVQFAQRVAVAAPALTKVLWYSHGWIERVV